MDQFNQVSVVKKANVYFDGKVTSRVVLFEDGTKKTLGIIMPGEYEFGTAEKEQMEMLSGTLSVCLDGSSEWIAYNEGETFEVHSNSKFKCKTDGVVDYCCSYIKE